LRVLSAGAAKAIVQAVAASVRNHGGGDVDAKFDAAGAIRAAFLARPQSEIVILPQAMLHALAVDGRIDPVSIAPLGSVPTGVAVREGEPFPTIGDADALRAALLRASGLYCPDVERATAGIHFVRVLASLGIDARVRDKLRAHANGAAAMAALASDAPPGSLGCTQVTEILYTPGVTLVGALPSPYELATTYAVGVSATASDAVRARSFAARLAGPATRALREAAGFEQL
jgi:molybdate transport system substrate-binding protein